MKLNRAFLFLTVSMFLVATFAWANGQGESSQAQKVVIKVADNLPDRSNGMGLVTQTILDNFTKSHPNVSFEVESYPDQPYQQKMKLYATAGQLPEMFKYWSFSTLLKPLVDSNLVRPLNRADFADIPYLPGALDSNVYNGKLYGIPVTADMWFIYYNKSLMDKAGVAIPTTIGALMDSIPKFKAQGIIPVATDGKDGWPLSITYDNIVERITGSFDSVRQAMARKIKFTDPEFVQAAQILQNMAKAGLFQSDLVTSDYGASRNLFGQEKAAMYLMGSWELGLVSDKSFSQNFRDNVAVAKFPVLASGKGKPNDLVAWYGGNWVLSANSKHAAIDEELIKYLAHEWGALTWSKQAAIPAQKIQPNASDTALAKAILQIAGEATATSGTTTLDSSTPAFKETHQKLCIELVSGVLTPEQFTQQMDAAAAQAAGQ